MSLSLMFGTALAAGALGSAHCLGMCGPVVTLLESGQPAQGMVRRLASHGGRLCGYAMLGAVAASAGSLLALFPGGSTLLGAAAATMMVLMGLQLAFDLPLLRALERPGGALWRRVAPLARRVLPATTVPRAFAAGLLWGALPCGLVYSAAALAAASGSAWQGALVMAGFWAGTVPALLLAGSAAGRLARWRRGPRTRRVAGALLCAGGVLALMLPLRHAGHDMAAGDALPPAAAGLAQHRH